MSRPAQSSFVAAAAVAALSALAGCATCTPSAHVTLSVTGPDVVSTWNEIATATVNLPPDPAGAPAEQRPIYTVDLATVHVAMYDAVEAIARMHRPFVTTAVTTTLADTEGASQEAAAGEAAYRVLRGLFPGRGAAYQSAYESFLAALPAGSSRDRGLAIGAEVARGVLVWRAADGRSVALEPYVPGTMPGHYRGPSPINRALPSVRPFALTSNDQFRAPSPPALGSAAYAADLEETRRLGGKTSIERTPAQAEAARFHAEPPFTYWPRNLRRLSMTAGSIEEHARLQAMLWVVQADAIDACFESKFHYQTWRPYTAIALARTDRSDRTDDNAAITADPAWAPFLPTPPHPEYPAAHGCASAAVAETLRAYFGTSKVAFDFDSLATGSQHHYASVDALVDEVQIARIAGGMHFRTATVEGAALGKQVAHWAVTHHFQSR